jgi:hypothetical protein
MVSIVVVLERLIELLKGTILVRLYMSMNIPARRGAYAIIIITISSPLGFSIYETGIIALIVFVLHDILVMTFTIKEYLFSPMALKGLELQYNQAMLTSKIPQEED